MAVGYPHLKGASKMADFFSAIFGRPSGQNEPVPDQGQEDAGAPAVRFRINLVQDMQRGHAAASANLRALLDACRNRHPDTAIAAMRRFADDFRLVGLTRSVYLYPYLRWALQRDRTATTQFESVHRDVERATLLIEAILTDYLNSPWDSDRRRRFVHVVVRIASLFSRSVSLESTMLLPLYLPPGQYRYTHGSVAA